MTVPVVVDFELQLLLPTVRTDVQLHSTKSASLVTELSEGNYAAVLVDDQVQQFMQVTGDVAWLSRIYHNVSHYVTKQDDTFSRHERELHVLCAGIAAVQWFVQNNYVGPPVTVPQHFQSSALRLEALGRLKVDGEHVYHLTQSAEMLAVAKLLLVDCAQYLQHCQTAKWWALRCVYLHQGLINERSPTFKDIAFRLISEMKSVSPLMTDNKYKDAQIEFHLEAAHALYFYYEAERASEHFLLAQTLTGLTVQLTGALGKRTRFQQTDKAQLMLEVTRDERSSADKELETRRCDVERTALPNNVALDDDTVLESIQLAHGSAVSVTSLNATEQAVILGLLYEHRKIHEGHGDIIREETLAFINSVLLEPQNWCVQTQALFKRAVMEQDSSRRTQRSLTQLEELVAQFAKDEPAVGGRISHVYCTGMPMLCHIQRESANLLSTIGAMSSALEIYLKLEMWDEVIKCYSSLGRREKAESVIRQQLVVMETPSLYCYLGDVTDDPQYYVQAWELSQGKFARAQKCLALYYLRRNEFEKSLEHFVKTLELNKLQVGVWFSYGCASMACEQYHVASTAFRRCVTLETENYEAWSNLATAYVRTNQKPRAFKAMKEALKCEYENWRLWENYLIVGTDVGEFEEVVKAYHRLIDLKDKYADADVLKIIVRAVNENLADARDKPSGHLRPKVQELFGRITSKVTTSADIWRLYAELLHGDVTATTDVKQRALQYLQKAHRCSTQAHGWEKDISKCKQIAEESIALGKVYIERASKEGEVTGAVQLLSAAKLMLKSLLTKIQNQHKVHVTEERHALPGELTSVCDELTALLERIEQTIQQRKTTS